MSRDKVLEVLQWFLNDTSIILAEMNMDGDLYPSPRRLEQIADSYQER